MANAEPLLERLGEQIAAQFLGDRAARPGC
jgi:hypothetical protein